MELGTGCRPVGGHGGVEEGLPWVWSQNSCLLTRREHLRFLALSLLSGVTTESVLRAVVWSILWDDVCESAL